MLHGPHSRNSVNSPLEFIISMPEGIAITEYQLIRLRPNKDYREFRTMTGGVFNQKSGAMRDMVPFEGKKLSARMYSVVRPWPDSAPPLHRSRCRPPCRRARR
jgi:hypothetical protein